MKSRGFTLIEVLVALAILALTAAAVSRQTTQVIGDLRRLEDKSLAFWIADNELTRMQVQERWPATGNRSHYVDWSGRRWLVTVAVSATPNVDIRRIDVAVSNEENEERRLVSLTRYEGRY